MEMAKPKVYISGKVSGLDYEYAKKLFNEAKERINATGKYEAVNPLDHDEEDTTKPWTFYMRKDIKLLMDCDMIYKLPNWEDSPGARLECSIANRLMIFGLYDWMIDKDKSIPQNP